MSLLFTESWMAYPRWTGGASGTGAGQDVPARQAYCNNISVFGLTQTYYNITQPGLTIPAVMADPLNPDRNVVWCNAATAANDPAGFAYLKLNIDQDGSKAVVCGFSVYFTAATYVLAPTTKAIQVWLGVGATAPTFYLSREGRVYDGAGVAQSTKKCFPDTQGYVEFRYYKNELRVWLDDVLVLQKTLAFATDTIEWRMYWVQAGSMTAQYAIGNLYVLVEDDVMPNVRLGPTTRVIGRRPNADVQAQWIRSAGASNAAVAGQDTNALPTNVLQTDTVGSTDFYSPATDAATAAASLVHAVTTRAWVGNIDPIVHTFDAGVRVGTDVDYGDNSASGSLIRYTTPSSTKVFNCVFHRLTAKTVIVGGTGPCLYVLKYAGAASLGWSTVLDAASSPWIVAIVENSVGRLFALTTDGVVYTCAPGVDESVPGNWSTRTSPGAGPWSDLLIGASDHLVVIRVSGTSMRSTDDAQTAWTAGSGPAAQTARTGIFANGLYIVAGSTGATATAYTSTDGLAWTTRAITASFPSATGNMTGIAYGNGLYVAIGPIENTAGNLAFYTSPDLITWTRVTVLAKSWNTFNATALNRVAYSQGRFVVVGNSTWALWSSDGVNWERFNIYDFTSQTLNYVAPTPDGYMIVGSNGYYRRFGKNGEKTPIEALSNRVLFRAAVLNPQTDVAWAGAEAAAAEFGMKLTT